MVDVHHHSVIRKINMLIVYLYPPLQVGYVLSKMAMTFPVVLRKMGTRY